MFGSHSQTDEETGLVALPLSLSPGTILIDFTQGLDQEIINMIEIGADRSEDRSTTGALLCKHRSHPQRGSARFFGVDVIQVNTMLSSVESEKR